MKIIPLTAADYEAIMQVWRTSVRATHHFLQEEDFVLYEKLIPTQYLPAVRLYGVKDQSGLLLGFLGLSEKMLEMLFISAAARGQGIGSLLLNFAVQEKQIYQVDVNEQNKQALGFYLKKGFQIVDRSAQDNMGKDYPLLHLVYKHNNSK